MMRTESFGWHSWRDVARELPLGAVFGIAVAFLESGGTKEPPDLETIVRNCIIGTCIIGVSRLLETLLSWAIEQSQFPIVFRSVLYAGGGWFGYFMGVGMTAFLFGEQDDVFSLRSYHFIYSMLATAVVSMLIGFVLHHNRKRNLRLRQSIERLKEHEFAEKELEIARAVQQRLLPPSRIERDGFRLTARTEAAHMVGGDFYEVVELSGGLVGIVVADVSGKGIAASLIMASCKAVIPFLASGKTAEEVVAALNDKLCRELESREFVALIYLQFDPLSGKVSMVNAGMPEPLLIRDRSSESLLFEGPRLPLGLRPELAYRATSLSLDVGAKIVFYSDGLPEAMAGNEALGYDWVNQLVRDAARQGDGSGTVDSVFVAIRAIPSLQILDDLTVVMLERRGHLSS